MSKNKKFYTPEDFEPATETINEESSAVPSEVDEEAAVENFNEIQNDRVVVEVANCEKLNVRSAPDGKASIFGVFPKGTRFHLIEDEHPTFYKIVTDEGLTGYAMKDFLKVIE